jgi:hypothetical protein
MAYDRELATAQIDSLVKSLSEKTLDKWKDTFERQTPTWLTSRRFDGGSRTRSEPTERRLSASMMVEESRILQVCIFHTLQKNLANVNFSSYLWVLLVQGPLAAICCLPMLGSERFTGTMFNRHTHCAQILEMNGNS